MQDERAIVQPMTEEAQKDLPWQCYALDYTLQLDQPAAPLNSAKFETVFYPWQRGFFTKFEQVPDEVVHEVVLERAHSSYEEEMAAEPLPSSRGRLDTKGLHGFS